MRDSELARLVASLQHHSDRVYELYQRLAECNAELADDLEVNGFGYLFPVYALVRPHMKNPEKYDSRFDFNIGG